MTDDTDRPRTGPAAGRVRIRCAPEDFQVDELIELQPEPAGEHLWLRVEKRGENTEYVARLLARVAGIEQRAVGWAGRKDRHALTTQWFSLQLPGKPDPDFSDLPPSVRVLECQRRNRKLHTGGLRGNRFRIVLRAFRGDAALLDRRLRELGEHGAPNYFGTQRFGHDASNLDRALAWFRGDSPVRDRGQRGMLLSAARSRLFNAILARRVCDGTWSKPLPGDLMVLDGRGSFFALETVDETIQARVSGGEIHPSGAMWGRGRVGTTGDVAALEQEVAAAYAELAAGLERNGLQQERRALRTMPRELAWRWPDAETLEVEFFLASGCYATTVLEAVLECEDASKTAGETAGV